MRKFDQMRFMIKHYLLEFARKFIIISDRFINLYLYFIVFACILSWVPNINPNYPLFNFIFKASGFYLLPPFMGFTVAPIIVMMILVLLSIALNKIYAKYYAIDPANVIVLTKEDFERELEKFNKSVSNSDQNQPNNLPDDTKNDFEIEKNEDTKDDCR